ncbi:MAG: hypothetical protein PHN69_03200 [Candidatus Pacebacteria bacterium]|nr:hypothetical protein [Candidatus Paceibacterota bacterium]
MNKCKDCDYYKADKYTAKYCYVNPVRVEREPEDHACRFFKKYKKV